MTRLCVEIVYFNAEPQLTIVCTALHPVILPFAAIQLGIQQDESIDEQRHEQC